MRSLLNEPIPGHAVFWSSVGGKPYPLSIRIQSFEALYKARDPEHNRGPAEKSFAGEIRARRKAELEAIKADVPHLGEATEADGGDDEAIEDDEPMDNLELIKAHAIEQFAASAQLKELRSKSRIPWMGVLVALADNLVGITDETERRQIAHSIVPQALNKVVGPQLEDWHTERLPRQSGSGYTTWIVLGPGQQSGQATTGRQG